MIKAIFFDFYNTLVHFWPPVEEIQVTVCRELGISVTGEGILRGYHIADDFFGRENSKASLAHRSQKSRGQFFTRYEQLILEGAGLDVSLALAWDIWQMTTLVVKDFVPFDDAAPALRELKRKGYTLGVLSNLNRDMESLVQGLGLGQDLDFCITSQEVGAEKPHPPIFLAALTRAGVSPQEAAYVGDQYHSDIEGARAVGLTPVLLDRSGWHSDVNDCHKVRSLMEVGSVVAQVA